MKKLLIISIFMTSLFSYSQDLTVNDIPISELDAQYIRVNAEVKLLRPFRASVFLDWGQISRIKEIFAYDFRLWDDVNNNPHYFKQVI